MLFNGQNKKFVDPRYFLHEAPAAPAAPAPPPPAPPAKVEFADQQQLAQQARKQTAYSKCDFADTIQSLIMSKVNITNPTLRRKLTDHKLGFVTGTVANFVINYAKQKGVNVGQLTPIALNKQGYAQACAFTPDQINKFKELFAIVPLEVLQKTVDGAAAQQAGASGGTAGGTLSAGQWAQAIKQRLKEVGAKNEQFGYANKAVVTKIEDYQRSLGDFDVVTQKIVNIFVEEVRKEYPEYFGTPAAQPTQAPAAAQAAPKPQTQQTSTIKTSGTLTKDGENYLYTTTDGKKVLIPGQEIEPTQEDRKSALEKCPSARQIDLCISRMTMDKSTNAIRKYAPMAK